MSDHVVIPFTIGFDSSECEDFDEREATEAGLKKLGEMIIRMGGTLTQPSPSQVGGTKFGACFVVERIHAEEIFDRLRSDPNSARHGIFDFVYPPGGVALRTGGHIWNSPDGDWENGGKEIKAIEKAIAFKRASESPAELKDRQQMIWQARLSATPEWARREGEAEYEYIVRLSPPYNRLLGPDSAGGSHLPPTLDRLPQPCETADAWAARVAVDGQALIDAMELFEECGKDPEVYLTLCPSEEETEFQWVMPGLFLRGTVTTVVGDSGIGKSTMLSELCAMAGSQSEGELTFLGQPIEGGRNYMVFSGEESAAILHERLNRFKGAEHGFYRRCVLLPAADKDIDECLAFVKRVRWQIALVIVDPALKFLRDENSADAVSALYDKLNQLAAEANCAVILVHHMRKGHVQRFDQMRGAIRGASAFVDRPRIVIGMRKRGADLVEIGILKSNIPPSEQIWGEVGKTRLFRQNRETMRLDPVDGPGSVSTATPGQDRQNSAELERWVLETVRASTVKGWEVRKTGRKSLYQGQPAAGGAYSRQAIERAQEALIAAGRLLDTEHGLKIADPAPVD